MQNPKKEREHSISVDTRKGAFLHTTHMERTVKVYGVIETELTHISMLNTLATIFSSIGSFFLALAVSIIVSWATQGQATGTSKIFLQIIMPACFFVALLFYLGVIWAIINRKSIWEEIGISSKQVTQNPSEQSISKLKKEA